MLHNNWILDIIDNYISSGELEPLATCGFIQKGRGAIYLDLSDTLHQVLYLSASECLLLDLVEPRRNALLNTISTYQPFKQIVILVTSRLGEYFEVATLLIELN